MHSETDPATTAPWTWSCSPGNENPNRQKFVCRASVRAACQFNPDSVSHDLGALCTRTHRKTTGYPRASARNPSTADLTFSAKTQLSGSNRRASRSLLSHVIWRFELPGGKDGAFAKRG